MDGASIKAFAIKYLSANVDDAFELHPNLAQAGRQRGICPDWQRHPDSRGLFYLLMDWSRFVGQLGLIPPRLQSGSDSFFAEADAVLGQYLRGQLLVMLTLAVFYSVGLALFGLDLALPIGIFTGLAMFVPYVGFGVGLVLAALAGLLQFSATQGMGQSVVMVAVVYGGGQLLESFFLTPRLVGERIGLHPLAVIFALLAFGQLLGFVGVLVALPLSAVLLVAIRRIQAGYLASRLYQG
jgi:predicted PurR-regulated permease PerM